MVLCAYPSQRLERHCYMSSTTFAGLVVVTDILTDRQTDRQTDRPFFADVAIFVLKRDVKLQLTN